MTRTEAGEGGQSWRDELPSFESAIPYGIRMLLKRGPYEGDMGRGILIYQAKALFRDFAGSSEIENLIAEILVNSANEDEWATVPFIATTQPIEPAVRGLSFSLDTQQRAMDAGLLEHIPAGQEEFYGRLLRPTSKLINGMIARVNGDTSAKVIDLK